VAQGIGIWIGVQAFINMGVNMGVLPTKGLTLPLMSFGGSGILVNCIALAILLRVDWENRQLMRGPTCDAMHCGRREDASSGSWPAAPAATSTRASRSPTVLRARLAHRLAGQRRRHGRRSSCRARLRDEPGSASHCAARGCCARLLLPLNLLRAFWQALAAICRVQADVVLGMGGYVTFPGGMMAALPRPAAGAARTELGRRPGQPRAGRLADRCSGFPGRAEAGASGPAIRCARTSPRCRRRRSASPAAAGR
jgi:hypothetical protein